MYVWVQCFSLSRLPSSAVTPLAPVFIPAFSLLPGEGFCGLHTFCGLHERSSSPSLSPHKLHKKKEATFAFMCLSLNTSCPGGGGGCTLMQFKIHHIYRHVDLYNGWNMFKKEKEKLCACWAFRPSRIKTTCKHFPLRKLHRFFFPHTVMEFS